MELIFLILALLQIKHWYIDFVNQTDEEVQYKGEYMDWRGVMHSLKHGMATIIIFMACGVDTSWAWVAGSLDFIIHYHIDWIKMNYGNRDIRTPQFWNHLGLDQMAHQLCYLFLLWMIV